MFVYSVVWSDVGFFKYCTVKKTLKEKQLQLTQLTTSYVQLEQKISQWKTDSFYVQKMAREDLQLAYSDELVYVLK